MIDTHDYQMFTDQGDALIHDLVMLIDKYQLHDKSVLLLLSAISKNDTFFEATDTLVREAVFAKLQRSS
jgi:hypothetical protein